MEHAECTELRTYIGMKNNKFFLYKRELEVKLSMQTPINKYKKGRVDHIWPKLLLYCTEPLLNSH
jgi:hypothetical protein